jgi:hypothetical protein
MERGGYKRGFWPVPPGWARRTRRGPERFGGFRLNAAALMNAPSGGYVCAVVFFPADLSPTLCLAAAAPRGGGGDAVR